MKNRNRGLSRPANQNINQDITISRETFNIVHPPIFDEVVDSKMLLGLLKTADDGFVIYIKDNEVFAHNIKFANKTSGDYAHNKTWNEISLGVISGTVIPAGFKDESNDPTHIYGFFWGIDAFNDAIKILGTPFTLKIYSLNKGVVFVAEGGKGDFYWTIDDNYLAEAQPNNLPIPPMEP